MQPKQITSIFIFVLQINLIYSDLTEFIVNNKAECADCLQNIFQSRNNVLIIHSNSENINHYFQNISAPYSTLNINKDIRNIKNNMRKYDFYIITIQNSDQLRNIFDKLNLSPAWKPRSKYLIIHQGIKTFVKNLQDILEIAWQKYVINFVVMQYNTVNLFTYYPYKNGICWKAISPELIGICSNITLKEMYPNKIPKTFKKCAMIVNNEMVPPSVINSTNIEPFAIKVGFEKLLVKTILQRMNITEIGVLQYSTFGYKLPNGTFSKPSTLNDIIENRCDMGMGRLYINDSLYWDFDTSFTYCQDTINWWVPKAGNDIQWRNLISIFSYTLWLILGVLLLVVMVIFWGFSIASNEKLNLAKCVLYTWYIFLLGGVPFPRTNVMRYLIISWTIFTLLVATFYQSRLLAILMVPIREHQVSNAKELYESPYHITLVPEMRFKLLKYGYPYGKEIVSRCTLVTNPEYDHLRERLDNFKTAYIGSNTRGKYHMQTCNMFYFEAPILEVKIAMHFKRGHPFLERFNELILLILSNGLFDKWLKEVDNGYRCEQENLEARAITLQQLIGAFFILIAGLGTSLGIFIFEIILRT